MQPITYLALFWLDLLPWFGDSSSLAEWSSTTLFSLSCSIGGTSLATHVDGRSCSAASPLWAWLFILAYVLAYFGGTVLNKESATFNMLCLVVVTASTALVWLIPGVNPESSTTPAWSVLLSLLLSVGGSVLWKRWEDKTPPEEQFAVLQTGSSLDGTEELLLLGRKIAGLQGDEDARSSYWGSVDEDS